MARKKYTKSTARAELKSIVLDSINLLDKIDHLTKNSIDNDTVRLAAVPILYSCWERVFRLGLLVGVRLKKEKKIKIKKMSEEEFSFWLNHQPFLQSFRDKQGLTLDTITGFVNSHKIFTESDLGSIQLPTEEEKIILTNSNVNAEVVRINAKGLGLLALPNYQNLDLTKLDELVGRRNAIGHGQIIKSPGEREFEQLVIYTKALINAFEGLLQSWYIQIK